MQNKRQAMQMKISPAWGSKTYERSKTSNLRTILATIRLP